MSEFNVYKRRRKRTKLSTAVEEQEGSCFAVFSSNEKNTLFSQQEVDCGKPSASCVTIISLDEKNVLCSSCVALTDKEKEQSYDRTENKSLGSVGIIDLSLDSRGMINLNAREEKEQSYAPGLIDLNVSKEHGSDGTRRYCLESTSSTATSKEKDHSFDGIEKTSSGCGGLDLNKCIHSLENVDGRNEQVMQTEGESTFLVSDAVIEGLDILGSGKMNNIPFIEPPRLPEFKPSNAMSQGAATHRNSENFSFIKETDSEKLSSNLHNNRLMRPQQKPKRKKHKPKVVIDGKSTSPKLATPKQEREKTLKQIKASKQDRKRMTKNLSDPIIEINKIKAPVARTLNFQSESLDSKHVASPIEDSKQVSSLIPNKKRRSKRRRKLNWFNFPVISVTKNNKKSKKGLFTVNWCGRKRRVHRKRPQKVKEADTNGALLVTHVEKLKKSEEMVTPKEFYNSICKSIGEARTSEFKKITSKRNRKESTSDAISKPKGPKGLLSKKQIELLIRKLRSLDLNDKGTLVPKKKTGTLVRYPGSFLPIKKKKAGKLVRYKGGKLVRYQGPSPKVDLDSETLRVWNLLMDRDDGRKMLMDRDNDRDQEKASEIEKCLEKEREVFFGRVCTFIARMRQIQGNRRFRKWNGSVLDSVIGVFLTQNTSDHLSSNAFMSLAAKFPPQPTCQNNACNEVCIMEAETEYDTKGNQYFVSEPEHERNNELGRCRSTEAWIDGIEEIDSLKIENIKSVCKSNSLETFTGHRSSLPVDDDDDATTISKKKGRRKLPKAKKYDFSSMNFDKKSKSTSRKKNKKAKDKFDWDSLRIRYSTGQRSSDQMDSVNWEAVRLADVEDLASVIEKRGQHFVLAENIQKLLNKLVKRHNCLDLEWLRNSPPDLAKRYLLKYKGLGLKSVECVRLLSLKHVAFPVDTHVGRITVRLGWVPLQPLPEDLHLHLLELYPSLDSVQKFLWPRLCTLVHEILYELHYQMITFGKVFCTKRNPNCNACPMRAECRHYASASSAKNALPGPSAGSVVSKSPIASVSSSKPITLLRSKPIRLLGSEQQTKIYEPIIEEPFEAPTIEAAESQEPEIEEPEIEFDSEGIPFIKLNLQDCSQINNSNYNSKALVALTSEAVSIPARKLKLVSRLRTKHLVYELPRNHFLLQGLEQTESDKDVQYHLAIWSSGETSDSSKLPEKTCNSIESELCNEETCFRCNNIREQNANIVRATILIPCRQANRRSFPLNGTYFQVNEVFADHETSLQPINVPRDLIYNLRTKIAYFGSSTRTMVGGLSEGEIKACFQEGIVCFRGFDRSQGAPRPLVKRLHYTKPSKKEKEEASLLTLGRQK